MERLIANDPRNKERIFPYIGGEELNDTPAQSFHRYTIDFNDLTETESRTWPDLMAIVEAKVKPIRIPLKREALVSRWWQYGEKRPGLRHAIRAVHRVLTISRVTQHVGFAFLPTGMVYADSLVVFCLPEFSSFAVLQSRIHDIWARFFGSSLEDRLRYSPSDCFETFPSPGKWQKVERLEQIGQTYYEFRAGLMVRNGEGMTATYNRFHNPDEHDPDILKLRELHEAMDRAVLDSYGWTNLKPTCEFILDYEEEEDDDGKPRRKKKPWRYRWPDEFPRRSPRPPPRPKPTTRRPGSLHGRQCSKRNQEEPPQTIA
jgi:hypothetical protein